MKNIFLIFKFIDNNNRKCSKYMFELYLDDKVDEWKMSDDGTEKHMRDVERHVKLVHEIKEYIKNHLNNSFFSENKPGEIFNGYRFIKEKCVKVSENINMTPNQPLLQSTIRRVKHMEKICFKFMSGTKPENWAEIFNYQKSEHHFYFHLEKDNDGRISYKIITPDAGKNGLIVPHIHNLTKETRTPMNINESKSYMNRGSQSAYNPSVPYLKTNTINYPASNFNSKSINDLQYQPVHFGSMGSSNDQKGGTRDNRYKYLKYKSKYINEKNNFQ